MRERETEETRGEHTHTHNNKRTNIYMGRSMETHPLFWKSVFLADFFSVSGGWAMKNRGEIVFGPKTY